LMLKKLVLAGSLTATAIAASQTYAMLQRTDERNVPSVADRIDAETPKQVGARSCFVNLYNMTSDPFDYRIRLSISAGQFTTYKLLGNGMMWHKFVRFYRPLPDATTEFTAEVEWDEHVDGVTKTERQTLVTKSVSPEEEHKLVETDKVPIASIGTTYYVERKNGRIVLNP
jgi:hypothetical protein